MRHIAFPVPPRSLDASAWMRLRRHLWAVPLFASLVFVSGVLLWAYRSDKDEELERHNNLIADALSTEAQLRARVDVEMAHLQNLARQLPTLQPHNAQGLAANAEVAQGLRSLWLGITWLDQNNRIVANVPERLPELVSNAGEIVDSTGMSGHLVTLVGSEKLVVRYSPTLLLRRGTPWWMARKYEVQLIDGSEQVIASLDDTAVRPNRPQQESYKVLVGGNMPGVFLELTLRELPKPFWRAVPAVLIAGFLVLMFVATALLRRQMRQVSLAEAAWRTQAALREAMEDSALVGLRARDSEGRILYVNRTFCDMVGLPAERLMGLTPPMPYWPPEAIEEVMLRNRRNLAGHAPRDGYEAQWRHQDGHTLNVMVFESPLINADGQQIGWMGSIIDITARKQLEERERHQAEAMSYQSRLTTLGEVASALAHQLNQPLTAVTGYNAGVQRMLARAGYDNAAVLHALQKQGEQAAEAGRIVQRIREFLTRRAPQRERSDLLGIAKRAVELLQRDLERGQVQVLWPEAAAVSAVYADPILMEQVLINLIRNAADALRGQARDKRIGIGLSNAGPQFVRIDIDDNGPGLDGRTIEQLTAPFYSTKSDGMGMGLAICRSIVEIHHGGMAAGVSPWGGARFSFTLPVYDPAASETAEELTL
jgi:two-component system sensor histidine kinase DctS